MRGYCTMTHPVRIVSMIGFGVLMLHGCAQTQLLKPGTTAPAADAQHARAPLSSRAVPQVNGKPLINAETQGKFEAVANAVRQQMLPGGRWQFVDKRERAMVEDSFADMSKLFRQFGSVNKMDDNTKLRLLADQSTVNAILTKRDGDRLICNSIVPVGSHLPVKTCRTYSQIQIEQRDTQDSLWKANATRQKRHCGLQQNGSAIVC